MRASPSAYFLKSYLKCGQKKIIKWERVLMRKDGDVPKPYWLEFSAAAGHTSLVGWMGKSPKNHSCTDICCS